MNILSKSFDNRINSTNLYIEMPFEEYLNFAKDIIKNNELQRKRVKKSRTVYSLLKDDLKQGCVMPPLVLAITQDKTIDIKNISNIELLNYIVENKNKLVILDGLQRTYTLIDADSEMKDQDPESYSAFLKHTLRLELYVGINKSGILYRMLTLNTGQTPMTARHQVEMLYQDMRSEEFGDIHLVTDVMERPDPRKYEFSFKNAIDGFNSYLERDELPIDKEDILANIKVLGNMSKEKMDQDLFITFMSCYANVFKILREASHDITYKKEDIRDAIDIENPFGNSVFKVFSTSQALTGFGAAIGKMQDLKVIESFDEISSIKQEELAGTEDEWFEQLLRRLDEIKNNARKIGNAQRMYFHYFFRELFNKDSDSYLNLKHAVENGFQKYRSQL
mgnify:FL=1